MSTRDAVGADDHMLIIVYKILHREAEAADIWACWKSSCHSG